MKTVNLLFPLILSCMMSFLIAGITTLKTVGFIDNFLMWMSAWIVAWMFAFSKCIDLRTSCPKNSQFDC